MVQSKPPNIKPCNSIQDVNQLVCTVSQTSYSDMARIILVLMVMQMVSRYTDRVADICSLCSG